MINFASCFDEMTKTALLERLVRLAATPVKGTPMLIMRSRTPAELKSLQEGVEAAYNKRITDPLMKVLEKGVSKLPPGKVQNIALRGAKIVAEDPVGIAMVNVFPLPGATTTYVGLKKGLEKGIDRLAPIT